MGRSFCVTSAALSGGYGHASVCPSWQEQASTPLSSSLAGESGKREEHEESYHDDAAGFAAPDLAHMISLCYRRLLRSLSQNVLCNMPKSFSRILVVR